MAVMARRQSFHCCCSRCLHLLMEGLVASSVMELYHRTALALRLVRPENTITRHSSRTGVYTAIARTNTANRLLLTNIRLKGCKSYTASRGSLHLI